MKRTLYVIALLLLTGTAQAQSDSAPLRGVVTDESVVKLEAGINTLFTTPAGDVFSIEMQYNEPDTTVILSSPTVKTRKEDIVLTNIGDVAYVLDCPADHEPVYFADRAGKYQMGLCARTADVELARRGLTRQDVQMKTGQGYATLEVQFSFTYASDR